MKKNLRCDLTEENDLRERIYSELKRSFLFPEITQVRVSVIDIDHSHIKTLIREQIAGLEHC